MKLLKLLFVTLLHNSVVQQLMFICHKDFWNNVSCSTLHWYSTKERLLGQSVRLDMTLVPVHSVQCTV
jgi:hypothetical protein